MDARQVLYQLIYIPSHTPLHLFIIIIIINHNHHPHVLMVSLLLTLFSGLFHFFLRLRQYSQADTVIRIPGEKVSQRGQEHLLKLQGQQGASMYPTVPSC